MPTCIRAKNRRGVGVCVCGFAPRRAVAAAIRGPREPRATVGDRGGRVRRQQRGRRIPRGPLNRVERQLSRPCNRRLEYVGGECDVDRWCLLRRLRAASTWVAVTYSKHDATVIFVGDTRTRYTGLDGVLLLCGLARTPRALPETHAGEFVKGTGGSCRSPQNSCEHDSGTTIRCVALSTTR